MSDITAYNPVSLEAISKQLTMASLVMKFAPNLKAMSAPEKKAFAASWHHLLTTAGVEALDLAPAFEQWGRGNREFPAASDIIAIALEIGVERRAQATRKPTCIPFEGEPVLGANAERFKGMTPEQMRADLRKRLEVEA